MKLPQTLRTMTCALLGALVACSAGCGTHRTRLDAPASPLQTGPSQLAPPAQPQDTAALFPGLPELPAGDDDVEQRSVASESDNIQTGSQAIKSSAIGAFVEQSRLDMGPLEVGKYAWGMWRWGKFTGQLAPRHLTVNLQITGQNKYWLLFANYGTGRWEVQGPLNSGNQTYDFSTAANAAYVSPLGNVYVALLAVSANTLVVETLNLIADADVTAPGMPTGLHGVNVLQHSARLMWNAPGDSDVTHYELWRVLHPTDDETTATSELIDGQIPADNTTCDLAPLAALTTYTYRVRAVDGAGNHSPLSVAGSFKTIANHPPVPAFTYTPQAVMKNTAVTFDPGATTDEDDLPGKLTVYWDWNGDGVDDAVSTGLSPITHAFHQQGLTTVKFSVWDTTDRVSVSKTFNVEPFQTYHDLGLEQSGEPVTVLAAATDYATGRVAAVLFGGGPMRVTTYDAGAWTTVDLTDVLDDGSGEILRVAAVALAPGGKTGVLTYNTVGPLFWAVYETTGGAPPVLAKSHSEPPADQDGDGTPDTQQVLGSGGALAYASNGRMAVAFCHSPIPPGMFAHEDWFVSAYHELANGSFRQGDLMWRHAPEMEGPFTYYGHYPPTPFAISRSDTTTTLVCTEVRTGQIQTDTLTDGTTVKADVQSFTGTEALLACGPDPANFDHVAWVLGTNQGSYFFGDNYGAANGGGQSYVSGRSPTALLSVLPTGDNRCEFYWAEEDAADETYLRGRNTGNGTIFELKQGVGLCQTGFGGWTHQNGQDGAYSLASEQRDGQVTGYFLNGSTILRQDAIAEPLTGGHMFTHSLMVTNDSGGLTVLAAQERPTALVSSSTTFSGDFTYSQFGTDTWAYPDAATNDAAPGEILLGSLYNVPNTAQLDLILNRFPAGQTVGMHVGTVKDVKQAYMMFSPKVGQPMLLCLAGDGVTFTARLWNGTAWGAPTTVCVAPTQVNEAVLRARPDGEWGVAWDGFDSKVYLAETLGSAWQAPLLVSTATLHLRPGSVDLQYSPNSDAGLAVERMDAADGVYFGFKPVGSAVTTWELTSGTKGLDTDSIEVHWLPEWGAVVSYNVDPLISGGGLRLAMRSGVLWNTTSLPLYMRGAPLSTATNAEGTMAWAGQDVGSQEGIVSFLNW